PRPGRRRTPAGLPQKRRSGRPRSAPSECARRNDARLATPPVPAGRRVSIPPPGGSRGLREAGRIEQAAPARLDDGRDAAVDAELAHRVRQVLLHRVAAEMEAAADLTVREPL